MTGMLMTQVANKNSLKRAWADAWKTILMTASYPARC